MSLTRNIDSAHYQKRGLEDFGYLQVAWPFQSQEQS